MIRDRSVDPIAEFVHRLAQPIADDVPEQWFKWWIRQRSEIGYAARVAPYVRIAKVMDGTDSATSALLCPSALGLRDRSSAFYCALCERAWGVLRSETDRRQ